MSLLEPQLTGSDSILDNDVLGSPHGGLALSITSEQSEPADCAGSRSESGRLSVSDLQVNETLALEEPKPSPEQNPARIGPATTGKKGSMSVSTNAARKASGDPPTPLVKRIINSGTFGAGSVKPAPGVKTAVSGSAAVPTKPAASASNLRRSTSAAPTATSKPAMTSRTPAAPAPPSRRASVIPTKPPVPANARNLLSSSANSKPTAAADPAKNRASVASPTGSVASARSATAPRPRASVSEAAKKPTPARTATAVSRTSAKPTALTRTAAPSAGKAILTAPSGSISSITELKEDTKALEDLQRQLAEVEDSLRGKTDSVGAMEVELQKLQVSFQSALKDIQAKTTLVTELESAKAKFEAQLKEAQASLGDSGQHAVMLEQMKVELQSAKTASHKSTGQVIKLQAQIAELEATMAATQGDLQSLQVSHAAALASAAQSSTVEHDALVKAKAGFEAISKEAEALKAAHAESIQASQAKIAELEPKVAELENVRTQIEELKAEREESANKLSELEVEVLELKEQIEELEDAEKKLKMTITNLEVELANSAKVLEELTKAASDRSAEAEARTIALRALHAQEVTEASRRYSALQETLQSLQVQLDRALAAQEQAAEDIAAVRSAQDEQIQQLEATRIAKEEVLNARIEAIQESLNNQEAIYNSRVQTVKDEHELLLKEAFARAKNEADTAHAQELHSLQNKSNAIITEIQTQNKTTLESLQNDHVGEVDSTIKGYTKQINTLNLELKATKDDLTKSKTALEELRKELEAVKGQRDAARASAEAAPTISPEHVEEVARLAKELAVSKDDLAAVTDMLNLTKSSLREMSEKHQKDVEELGESRVAETRKLTAGHDEDIKALASQKSDLLVRLSDLEGELSTAKAALTAAQTASPKSNGAGPQHPVSPGVSKEELAKLHEAHTLKIYDLRAEHEKALQDLKEELEKSRERGEQLAQEVERKNMEIKYMEEDQEEHQGEITRLREALEGVKGDTQEPFSLP